MRSSECANPFRACNSSSHEAVWRVTWNNAGSVRANGHHDVTNGFEHGFKSKG